MKKYLFSLIFVLVSYLGFSQKGLSYQAIILDPNKIEVPGQDISGQPLVNGDVWIKFSISSGANLQFEEVQKTKTDAYGLVNLLIGSEASSSFNSLVWDASQKNLQVYISFDQGGSYTLVSDQKLSYNPYSLFAETAGKLGATLPISGGGTGATTAADARTNLGLDQVNNTSDAAKPVSTATQTALNLKANSSDMNAALALKANTADMNAALAFKSDTSYVLSKVAAATIADANANTKGKIQLAGDLAGTADAPTVPGLALKANTTDVVAGLSLKANSTDVVNSLNLKANATDITSALALKANASELTSGLALKLNASQLGVANGIATLNSSGIIPSNQLPPVTISSTNVVASDAAMVALSNATVGSIAVRTDVNKNYVLSAIPASTLANWIELLTPGAPVQTVNGYTGSVSLVKSDIGLANVDNTSDVNKQVSAATQAALNLKADTASVRTALALKLNMTDANAALNLKLNANKVGVANGTASLNAQGKIPTDQIPAISFSSVKVLGSESDMLALRGAVVGSVVIRTDVNKNYVLAQADPSVLANWIQLLTPAPPVQTVNGYAGNVSITKSDVDLANAENTSDANKPVSVATQTALDLKANTASLATVATTGNYNDLFNLPTTTTAVDASNLSGTLAISSGGTGSNTKNFIDLSTDQTIAGAKVFTTNGTYAAALTVSGNLVAPNIGSSSVLDFTHRIVSAATSSTFTKLIQFGTGGVSGSNTILNMGSGQSGANNAITIGSPGAASTTLTTIHGAVVLPTLSGYVKGNGTTAVSASATIPATDITGLIKKVNGNLPDVDGNVDISFGTVTTGTLANRPVNAGTNGNIYIVSSDATTAENGRTFISDGTSWKEVTGNQSATDITGVVAGANGGTGVANTGKTITLGGNFSTGHALVFSTSGATTLSLPTSGTLATVQQVDAKELISNKSTDVTLGAANNPTSIGDTKFPTQNAVKAYVASAFSTAASPLNGYTITSSNGNSNVGLGVGVASSTMGNNNTSLGTLTLAHVSSGDFNVIIGAQAARYISRSFGDWATNNQSMNRSIFIGSMTRASSNNATNEIVIGYEATGSGSNTIQLGNTAITDVKTNGKLTSGAVTYPKTHGTSGQVLSTTGSGELAWASVVDVSSSQTIAGLKTFSNKVTLNSGTAGGATLEVNGASTNTAAFNAANGTSIDFTKSNLAYTSANAGAFSLTGMKDGGTYTLAVQGTTSGTAAFTQTGLTFTSINNAATTASKHTLYTFIVMGTTVYYSMMTGL